MKISFLGLALLSVVIGDGVCDAPDSKFLAFKIATYFAVALRDGALEEPNDGKSFLVGQPPAAVAALLESGGAPGGHFEFRVQPMLVHAGERGLLFDAGAGGSFGDEADKQPTTKTTAGEDPAKGTDIFIS